MNFSRGKQMIVYDQGLNHMGGSVRMSEQLTPPIAFRRWTLHPHNSPRYVISRVAEVAAEVQGLDAVHFMGHGHPGGIEMGSGELDAANADLFEAVHGVVRNIVFFSCSVGGEHQGGAWHRSQPTTIGQRIRDASGARVVVAQQVQRYNRTSDRVVTFGRWEGPVDVYEGNTVSTHQVHNPFRTTRPFNLEEIVFG